MTEAPSYLKGLFSGSGRRLPLFGVVKVCLNDVSVSVLTRGFAASIDLATVAVDQRRVRAKAIAANPMTTNVRIAEVGSGLLARRPPSTPPGFAAERNKLPWLTSVRGAPFRYLARIPAIIRAVLLGAKKWPSRANLAALPRVKEARG